jgi:hypothetical protein
MVAIIIESTCIKHQSLTRTISIKQKKVSLSFCLIGFKFVMFHRCYIQRFPMTKFRQDFSKASIFSPISPCTCALSLVINSDMLPSLLLFVLWILHNKHHHHPQLPSHDLIKTSTTELLILHKMTWTQTKIIQIGPDTLVVLHLEEVCKLTPRLYLYFHGRKLLFVTLYTLVWPVPLAQVWTHYKIGKLNTWTLFSNVSINFLNSQYERKSCLNWMVSLQVLPRPKLIFPSKTWFFGIYLDFQWQKSL